MSTYSCIDITDALPLLENQVTIVDIRYAASYQTSHISDAINLNNDNVQEFISSADKSIPVIVCCYHGNMSKGAAEFFSSQGFLRSYSLNGGYTEWAKQA